MCEKEKNIRIMLGADRALRLNDQPNTVYDELQQKYFKRFLQSDWGRVYKSMVLGKYNQNKSKRRRDRLFKLLYLPPLYNRKRKTQVLGLVFQFVPHFKL